MKRTNLLGAGLLLALFMLVSPVCAVTSQPILPSGAAFADDLAVLRIPSPHMGSIAESWPVEVIVCNLGLATENAVPVQVTIEDCDKDTGYWTVEYVETIVVSVLDPQDPVTLHFPDWMPSGGGTVVKFQVTAEIQVSDRRPINNLMYEIFTLGDGATLSVAVPSQSNTVSQFKFTITNSDGLVCCPEYEVDVVSLFPNTPLPSVCDRIVGAVTVPSSPPVTVWVPVPPVTSFSFFRITITIVDTEVVACGLALPGGRVVAWP